MFDWKYDNVFGMFIGSHNLLLYDTTEEFNVDLKAECDQLNLANIIRNKKKYKNEETETSDLIWNIACKYGINTSKRIECTEKIQRRATKLVHDFNNKDRKH